MKLRCKDIKVRGGNFRMNRIIRNYVKVINMLWERRQKMEEERNRK